MSSAFGSRFRVTTFGESHGGGLGAIVEGCPPGMAIDYPADIAVRYPHVHTNWDKALEALHRRADQPPPAGLPNQDHRTHIGALLHIGFENHLLSAEDFAQVYHGWERFMPPDQELPDVLLPP